MIIKYTVEDKNNVYNYLDRVNIPVKVLIGTPVTEKTKLGELKKWLKSVSEIEYPADVLIINSSNKFKKLHEYCRGAGFKIVDKFTPSEETPKASPKNYIVRDLDLENRSIYEKNARSFETMRQEALNGYYDLLLNWEPIYSLPPNALLRLIEVMENGKYSVVSHVPDLEEPSAIPHHLFGVDLIMADALTRYGFLIDYPDMPRGTWQGVGLWLKKRAIRDGKKCIELDINNESHFNECVNKEEKIKLNLGCAGNLLPGYINIDILEPCDLKHDLREPLPFNDASVDEIYTDGNTISLFLPKDWYQLKKEMARVLKPAGKLEILFWDLEYLFKAFLENKHGQRWGRWIELIFAGQGNEYEYAKNGFTYEKLVSDLKSEGMEKFSKVRTNMPEYLHLRCFKKIFISLIAFLIFIPKVIFTDISLMETAITPEEDSPPEIFMHFGSRFRKKQSKVLQYFQQVSGLLTYNSLTNIRVV